MLSYPAAIPLSTRSLNHLAGLIRAHRDQRRSRWRRLEPGRQALLALAHLRNGDTLSRLAAGFQIGVTTAWRYVREAIDLLAATSDDLSTAMPGFACSRTRSSTAPSSRSTGSPTRSPTTPASIADTA